MKISADNPRESQRDAAVSERARPKLLLNCIECNAKLDVSQERCACPRCGSQWPITNGIPRFFHAPEYYWGEIARNEARELLEAARTGSWEKAVRARFPEGDDMHYGLLDPQRAAWLPLLALDERSVALDIGCGYGAITHSIARVAGEVYAVETVPERIEFTQERLRQEGIRNVHLIQAFATALPLQENSFDLVVVNGILEWVGEWDWSGDPRKVHLRFLSNVRRLLKQYGVLVIGIENRFGYGLLLGAPDHSGIAYTSLVPRWVASVLLRHSSAHHHRTRLNSQKEYRTYTYMQRGYRNLLKESGFDAVSCYWAEPGYNRPYCLTPVDAKAWIQEHFLYLLDHPSPSPRKSWRRRLKRFVARSGLLPLLLPDFVLFATKRPGRKTKLQQWCEQRLQLTEKAGGGADQPRLAWSVRTHAFAGKSILRLGDPNSGAEIAYLKAQVGAVDGSDCMGREQANLSMVRNRLQDAAARAIDVPRALGTLHIGHTWYCLESASNGVPLSRTVFGPDYFRDERRVERDFVRITERVIDLTAVLSGISRVNAIPPGWREIPAELESCPELQVGIESWRQQRRPSDHFSGGWIQHGDLSVENVFLDSSTGRLGVIDWGDMAARFPELYDLFSLLFSTGYLLPAAEAMRFPNEEERWIASFHALFLSETGFGRLVWKLVFRACERLNVAPERVPALLVEFLLVRTHYYRALSPVQHRVHQRLLRSCFERERPLLELVPTGHFPPSAKKHQPALSFGG
jgi:ubiquinone/menaquinone biosynthesis C-methylase UbiE